MPRSRRQPRARGGDASGVSAPSAAARATPVSSGRRSGARGGVAAAADERAEDTADRLHSAAIHLLRRVRIEDDASGLSGPQLSALSVIVFRGPLSLGALAAAEQVRPPTVTRMIRELERQGLVERTAHATDARVQHVRATKKGARLLQEGRRRRVRRIAGEIAALAPAERAVLREAARLLEELGRGRGN